MSHDVFAVHGVTGTLLIIASHERNLLLRVSGTGVEVLTSGNVSRPNIVIDVS